MQCNEMQFCRRTRLHNALNCAPSQLRSDGSPAGPPRSLLPQGAPLPTLESEHFTKQIKRPFHTVQPGEESNGRVVEKYVGSGARPPAIYISNRLPRAPYSTSCSTKKREKRRMERKVEIFTEKIKKKRGGQKT